MDEDLERLRRACRESPDDFALALKLSAACERAGDFESAWAEVVRFASSDPRSDDSPELLAALRALAARNRRALLRHVETVPDAAALFSLRVLGRVGELAVLATVASNVALPASRRAQAIFSLSLRPMPGDRTELGQLRAKIEVALPAALSWFENPMILAPYLPELEGTLRAQPEFAEKVLENAERVRDIRIVPLLVACLQTDDVGLRARTRALFEEVSGQPGPPLDPDLVAKHLASR